MPLLLINFVMSWFSNYLGGLFNFLSMGLFKNYSSGRGSGSYIDKIFESLVNQTTGAGLTGAQKEANRFSSAEAEKDRVFQEMQRTTQYQTAVKDMQAAGVNPALIYGGSGGSAGTTGGASVSSVSPGSGGAGELLSFLSSMVSSSVQKQAVDNQYDIDKGKLRLQEQDLWLRENMFGLQTEIGQSQIKVNEAQAILLKHNLRLQQSEITLNNAKIQKIIKEKDLVVSQTDLNNSITLINKIESEYRPQVIEASLNYTNSMVELNKLGKQELVQKIKNAKTSGEILEIQKGIEDQNLQMLIQRSATYKEFLDNTLLKLKADIRFTEAERKWMGFKNVVNGITAVSDAAYDWVSLGSGKPAPMYSVPLPDAYGPGSYGTSTSYGSSYGGGSR